MLLLNKSGCWAYANTNDFEQLFSSSIKKYKKFFLSCLMFGVNVARWLYVLSDFQCFVLLQENLSPLLNMWQRRSAISKFWVGIFNQILSKFCLDFQNMLPNIGQYNFKATFFKISEKLKKTQQQQHNQQQNN